MEEKENKIHATVVIAGVFLKFQKYQIPIRLGIREGDKKTLDSKVIEEIKGRFESSIIRTCNNFEAKAYSNFSLRLNRVTNNDYFLTVTFENDISVNEAYEQIINYIDLISRKIKKWKKKYIIVVGMSKNGKIHFHVILYDICKNIKEHRMKKIINEIKVKNVGYTSISKIKTKTEMIKTVNYMKKNIREAAKFEILEKRKLYFSSKNLKKPKKIIITDKYLAEEILANALENEGLFTKYENKYLGEIKQVKLVDSKKVKKVTAKITVKKKRKRRKTEQERLIAVALIKSKIYNIKTTAEKYKVTEKTIKNWEEKYCNRNEEIEKIACKLKRKYSH